VDGVGSWLRSTKSQGDEHGPKYRKYGPHSYTMACPVEVVMDFAARSLGSCNYCKHRLCLSRGAHEGFVAALRRFAGSGLCVLAAIDCNRRKDVVNL